MLLSIKDMAKLIGIMIISCCAVFVCTLFLNYQMDLMELEPLIVEEAAIAMVQAQLSMGKIIVIVTGACLVVTSMILLLFYIKNYIDSHSRQLGVLKALGYHELAIAKHFWCFGISVFLGALIGYMLAYLYFPTFYEAQNEQGLFPSFSASFHPLLAFAIIAVPTFIFFLLSILYAYTMLKHPVLDLLNEKVEAKNKPYKDHSKQRPFLKELSKATLQNKRILTFFVTFSAFCFSAMVQMSLSMVDLASETFAFMMVSIGLILAFMTLLLSLSACIKGNTKTIAMMRVLGYDYKDCAHAILHPYRPFSYLGFAIGTIYQYALLKLVMCFVFEDVEHMPVYHFNTQAFGITLLCFVIVYELIMVIYSMRIQHLSLKSIMLE